MTGRGVRSVTVTAPRSNAPVGRVPRPSARSRGPMAPLCRRARTGVDYLRGHARGAGAGLPTFFDSHRKKRWDSPVSPRGGGLRCTQPKPSNVLSTYGVPHGASCRPTRPGLRLGARHGVGRTERAGPGRRTVPGAAEPPVRGRTRAHPTGGGRDRARSTTVSEGAPALPAAAGHPPGQARPGVVAGRHRGGLPRARRLPRPAQRGHRTAETGPRGRCAAVLRGLRRLPPRRQPVRGGTRPRHHRRRRLGRSRAPLVPDGHVPAGHPAHPRRRAAPAPAQGAGPPAVRAPAAHPAAPGRPGPLPRRHSPVLLRVGAVADPPRARRRPAQPRGGRRDPALLRGRRRLPARRGHRGARHRPRRDRAGAGNRRTEHGEPDAGRPAGARCTEHRHACRAALPGGLEVAGRPPRRPAGPRGTADTRERGPRGGAGRPEGCRGGTP